MKNKLFGNRIPPSCTYCKNALSDGYAVVCSKSKQIKNGKCRSFDYDPLMREPKSITLHGTYTAEDFKL